MLKVKQNRGFKQFYKKTSDVKGMLESLIYQRVVNLHCILFPRPVDSYIYNI